MSNNILILPDIHGRTFWKEPCKDIGLYDKIIFLGDYIDPYKFEHIDIKNAIDNFKQIIHFKRQNMDKVILLFGNHDMPYAFKDYYKFSLYHCRHSKEYHNIIANLFRKNIDLFQIAYVYNNILFTHAGVESKWLEKVVDCKSDNIIKIVDVLNHLTENKNGLLKLFKIGRSRGGRDRNPSCIWADVEDMKWDTESDAKNEKPIHQIKQVFGHTLQAFYDLDGHIAYGDVWQFGLCKMLDNAKAYLLNSDNFTIKEYRNI